jgi:hypothetical protein
MCSVILGFGKASIFKSSFRTYEVMSSLLQSLGCIQAVEVSFISSPPASTSLQVIPQFQGFSDA